MLNNLPQVTKNILLINILVFVLCWFYESQGIDLRSILGAHYVNSPLFEPYQIVTHFFVHADFFHILFNMWIFVMLGAFLENLWGPKRFFIFYIACALGAFAFYNIMGAYQIHELKTILSSKLDIVTINNIIENAGSGQEMILHLNNYLSQISSTDHNLVNQISEYIINCSTPMMGASGAIFGIMAAFAILFPNTEFLLYFAIPVKAKFLVGGYFLWEVYRSINVVQGDNVAHLAHVGGAVVGAIIIFIWRKQDKRNFW